MNVVIIKYNAGNIQSVLFALERIGIQATVTDDADLIKNADKVIFPGVGEASTAMKYLKDRKLDELILSLTQPVLGICLGMQLLCKHSEENNTDCIGIFENVKVYFISFLRLVVIPVISLAILKISGLVNIHPDGKKLLLIVFLAVITPSASTITQMCQVYGNDSKYASAINVMTTLLSIITMPLMVLLYQTVM